MGLHSAILGLSAYAGCLPIIAGHPHRNIGHDGNACRSIGHNVKALHACRNTGMTGTYAGMLGTT